MRIMHFSVFFIILRRNSKIFLMDFKPQYYKTHPLSLVLKLETVTDKRGNIKFAVTLSNGVKENTHYLFEHLGSALDFINSNFTL